MQNKKRFYEYHKNFSLRTATEYDISPGIKCKFDLIKEMLNINGRTWNALDLGCSGNSILLKFNNFIHESFFDIANLPLEQYVQMNHLKNQHLTQKVCYHPICGDLSCLPYRDNIFNVIFALDVLEHVKNDQIAIKEINRISRRGALIIMTFPHSMRYYTAQDKLIGHYRRYELSDVPSLLKAVQFKLLKIFGIYGRFMKVATVQSSSPDKVESNIQKLRNWYSESTLFRKFWDVIVIFASKMMKWDAKFTRIEKMRNIGMIMIKRF